MLSSLFPSNRWGGSILREKFSYALHWGQLLCGAGSGAWDKSHYLGSVYLFKTEQI